MSFVDFSCFNNFFDTNLFGATNTTSHDIKDLLTLGNKNHEVKADMFCAKPSRIVHRSNIGQIESDGDIWVQVKTRSRLSDRVNTYFISMLTGKKLGGEPPTGASRVIYLK